MRAACFLGIALAVASSQGFGAVLTVTNLADSGPGTLRDRIAAATPGDRINFAVDGAIILNSQLTITNNLRIEGHTSLKVSGNHSSRIFNITNGSVEIFTLGISDGRVVGTNGPAGSNGENVYGGGVFVANGASLLMQFCFLSNNVAIGGQGGSQGQFGDAGNGGNAFGGGIGSLGSVNLGSCRFVGNSATGGLGGVAPTGSPGVGGQGWGGGLYVQGTALVSMSTVYGNSAVAGSGGSGPGGGAGGGIYNAGTLHLSTCTVASNAATGSNLDFGGGIHNASVLTVRSCTIAGNQADFGGGATGGDFANTILALNSASTGPDGSGNFVSSGYNLIQNTNALFISGMTTQDIFGQNPLLAPLTNNGGGTLTMALLAGSPAIDKGRSTESVDQRFRPRVYDGVLLNAAGGNGADIGAFEVHPGALLVLNTNSSGAGSLRQALLDNHGLGGSNTISFSSTLSGTINLHGNELYVQAPANIRGPGPQRLAISANTNGRVLNVFAGPTQISGLAFRDGLVIGQEGGNMQDGFDATGGGIYNLSTLTLSNCVIQSNTVVGGMGGKRHLGAVGKGGRGLGGGIHNAGGALYLLNCSFDRNRCVGGQGGSALSGDAGEAGNGVGGGICTIGGTNQLLACSVTDNLAEGGKGGFSAGGSSGYGGQGFGAGIYSESEMTATCCTISGGSAVGGTGGTQGGAYGGGIYNLRTLSLSSCTIASNSASGSNFDFGGGIFNVSTLGVTNSTIAGNRAGFGGGLHGNATFANTILAANTAVYLGQDGEGTIHSYDYNLIQTLSGVNILGATANVIFGQDPLLGPLADNGGPTRTMALRYGSPAIDLGRNFGVLTDQRGAPRPFDFASVGNATGGDGSDIGAFELGMPGLFISRARTNAVLRWPAIYGDFVLESGLALPNQDDWMPVTNTPVIGTGEQFYVTNSAGPGNKFYRLKSR